jgi:hypothetical protein
MCFEQSSHVAPFAPQTSRLVPVWHRPLLSQQPAQICWHNDCASPPSLGDESPAPLSPTAPLLEPPPSAPSAVVASSTAPLSLGPVPLLVPPPLPLVPLEEPAALSNDMSIGEPSADPSW